MDILKPTWMVCLHYYSPKHQAINFTNMSLLTALKECALFKYMH